MDVEMFVGYPDKTWDTTTIEIPDDTKEENISETAASLLMRAFESEKVEVAFVGVFHTETKE